MLENSGLVLGVDSSLGLLTRLHNPRHVGVALGVHGRLLHLMHTQRERDRKQRLGVKRATLLHVIALIL